MNTALGNKNLSNSNLSEQFFNFNTENLKSILSQHTLVNFDNVKVNDISPEDLKWSTELCNNNVINNSSKYNTLDERYVSENELGNGKSVFDDSQHTYKVSKVDNFVYRSQENCEPFKTENTFKINKEVEFKELKFSENKCSEIALKCLYEGGKILNCGDGTNDQRSIITPLENDTLKIPEGGIINIENPPVDYHKLGFNSQPWGGCLEEKPFLHAETISLITNGIIGEFCTEDPPFSNDERYYDQEQVVPTDSNVYENDYPGINVLSGSTQGQYSTNYEPENKITEQKGKQLKGKKVVEDEQPKTKRKKTLAGKQLKGKKVVEDEQPKTKRKKILADFSTKELWAFTPGGQIHRLIKGRTVGKNTKEIVDQKYLEIAMELNCYKKLNQLQNGIFVPEGLDFNKEEAFNSWFREEREKTEAIFNKFDVELNTRYLAAERQLLRLDRKLKQYMLTNPTFAIEELEFIKTFDIALINLVYTPQVYETLTKVSKMPKKGNLVEKVGVVLEKFKALVAPPQEVEVEDYLKKMRPKEGIRKLKPTAPTEWIIHLIKP